MLIASVVLKEEMIKTFFAILLRNVVFFTVSYFIFNTRAFTEVESIIAL